MSYNQEYKFIFYIATTRGKQRRRIVVSQSLQQSNLALRTNSFRWFNHFDSRRTGVVRANVL